MRIEYEDRELLVVYKEAGLPVQTARTSRRDLVSLLKNHLAQAGMPEEGRAAAGGEKPGTGKPEAGKPGTGNLRTGKPESGRGEIRQPAEPYLGIVHRLDQPVEGLLVFAKTPESAAALSAQAAAKGPAGKEEKAGKTAGKAKGKPEGKYAAAGKTVGKSAGQEMTEEKSESAGMEKIYYAAAALDASSYPLAVEGLKRKVTLVDWLGRDNASNTAYIAVQGERGAKRAKLEFRTLRIRESRALLEIRLLTGRHHQIRIQMANAGMPLLGDRKYGGNREQEASVQGKEGADLPLCLCAASLSFVHPAEGKRMSFHVEPAWLPLVSE